MDSFLARLKERKLVQWALAYAAVAWLLLQVADTLGTNFGWPPGIFRGLTVLLGGGFAAVLVLAWYHGEKGRQRASTVEVLLLAGIVVVSAGLWRVLSPAGLNGGPAAARAAESRDASIAVLPFENMSADPENEYFSDGITEDLLTRLSGVPGVRVISRTSVLAYKGTTKNIRQIGAELGVRHILEGSVRRAGDRVRITAQLIDASNDQHLWAETYDRQLTDVFAIQAEIAQHISEALRLRLSREQRAQVARSGTGSVAAYDLYLRGRYLLRRESTGPRQHAENVTAAVGLFREALRQDSTYALAFVGLSDAYTVYPDLPTQARYDSAMAFARRALRLQPTLPEAYVQLGSAHAIRSEYPETIRQLRRALELNPNHVDAISALAIHHSSQGRLAVALREMMRAAALEPTVPQRHFEVAHAYRLLNEPERAWQWMEKGFRLEPNPAARACAAADLAFRRGDLAEGDRQVRALLESHRDHAWAMACAGEYEIWRGRYASARELFTRFAALSDPEAMPYEELGYLAQRLGDRAAADSLLGAAERRARERFRDAGGRNWSFGMAKLMALRGRREEALDYLQQRIASGWHRYYVESPFWYFETIADDPRYQRLMAGVREHIAAERERAREMGL